MKRSSGSRTPRRERGPRPAPGLLLFLAAFALRAAVAWLTAVDAAAVAPELEAIASNLAHGRGFSRSAAGGPVPTALVPPVLPWLMSLTTFSDGHGPVLAHGFAVILFQCALGAFAAALIGWFGAA